MPMRARRKRFGMEKVENLYRTARAQNDSTNTPKQIRSRLRDSRRRRAATNRAGWPIRNRGSLAAKVLSRKSCSGSARARIRSQRDLRRRRDVRLDLFLSCQAPLGRRVRGGLQPRGRSGGQPACGTSRSNRCRCARWIRPLARPQAIARNESFRCGIFPNVAQIRPPALMDL